VVSTCFNPSEKYDYCHVPNHQPVKVFSVQLNLSNQRNHPSRPATVGRSATKAEKQAGEWQMDVSRYSKYLETRVYYINMLILSPLVSVIVKLTV
jgi:hypothetical protein